MAKNNRSRKNKITKKSKGSTIQGGLRRVVNIPVTPNPITRIARATARKMTYNAANGLDGFAGYDLQLTFAPGATRYHISGAAVYADSLPGLTDFSNLFDSWRISKVVVRIDIPLGLSNSASAPSYVPQIVYAPDYNDATGANKTDLLQYPQVQVHNFNKDGFTPFLVEFSPRALVEVPSGVVSTAYSTLPSSSWFRTSNMDSQHYGIKMVFDNYGSTNNLNYPLEFTVWYHMEFTNPK